MASVDDATPADTGPVVSMAEPKWVDGDPPATPTVHSCRFVLMDVCPSDTSSAPGVPAARIVRVDVASGAPISAGDVTKFGTGAWNAVGTPVTDFMRIDTIFVKFT